jgi:hypothetical protein
VIACLDRTDLVAIRNKILVGNVMDRVSEIPDNALNEIATSPPYWNVRDYGTEGPIWGGDPACEHEFTLEVNPARHWTPGDIPSKRSILGKRLHAENGTGKSGLAGANTPRKKAIAEANKSIGPAEMRPGQKSAFCSKCGAWRGNLGLEPDPDLFVSHLADVFDAAKPKLRDDGILFVNLGDTFSGSGGAGGDWDHGKRADEPKWRQTGDTGLPAKSLVGIPWRFNLEMLARGWACRNTLIWWKPACMPSSAPDRYTIDYEAIFFFVKNTGNPLFFVNEKTGLATWEVPPKIEAGIEGIDWDYQECSDCHGAGTLFTCPACTHEAFIDPDTGEEVPAHKEILKKSVQRRLTLKGLKNQVSYWCEACEEVWFRKEIEPRTCERCNGTGTAIESNWQGHDYYFRQRLEPLDDPKAKGRPFGGKKRAGGQNKTYSGNEYDAAKLRGKNARAVWSIATRAFKGKHFATFPPELARRMIEAGCPKGVCPVCGLPVVEIIRAEGGALGVPLKSGGKETGFGSAFEKTGEPAAHDWNVKAKDGTYHRVFAGYSHCNCNAGTEPSIVFDPFLGAGTVGMVANQMNVDYVGCELNEEYAKTAQARINSGGRAYKPEEVPKPQRLEAFL